MYLKYMRILGVIMIIVKPGMFVTSHLCFAPAIFLSFFSFLPLFHVP